MSSARTRHLLRGWSVASVGIWAGLASHLAAGGQAPGPFVLLLCWALAGLLCVGASALLDAGRLSGVVTVVGLLGSQAVLHGLMSLSGRGVQLSPAGGAASGHGMAAHAGHQHLNVLSSGTGGAGHGMVAHGMMDHGAMAAGHAHAMTPGMALLHLAAALLACLVYWRGEQTLRAAGAVARMTLAALRGRLRPLPALPSLPGRGLGNPVRTRVRSLRSQRVLGARGLRGPPVLFFS